MRNGSAGNLRRSLFRDRLTEGESNSKN